MIYNKYYVDEIYDAIFVKPITALSNFFSSVFEFLVIDLIVEGIGKGVKSLSSEARLLQSGTTGNYIFIMVLSIVGILGVSFFGGDISQMFDSLKALISK